MPLHSAVALLLAVAAVASAVSIDRRAAARAGSSLEPVAVEKAGGETGMITDHKPQGPMAKPKPPKVVSTTDGSVTLLWETPEGAPIDPAPEFNLLMDEVSIYSGPLLTYKQTGLYSSRCYSFQVAWYDPRTMRWSRFSQKTLAGTKESGLAEAAAMMAREHPTPAAPGTQGVDGAPTNPLDMANVDSRLARLRRNIQKAAIAPLSAQLCSLAGYARPVALAGGPGWLEVAAEASDQVTAGATVSRINCQIVKCSMSSAYAFTMTAEKAGHLNYEVSPGQYKLRFVHLVPDEPILHFADPKNSMHMASVNLHGCHAEPLGTNCLRVNCTVEAVSHVFCGSSFDPLDDGIMPWVRAINAQVHPKHTLQRFEVHLKISAVPPIANEKDTRKRLYEHAGYREPWLLTWLNRLMEIGATPHFPLFLDSFRCGQLPKNYRQPPPDGIMPRYIPGGFTLDTVASLKAEGGEAYTMWHTTVTEPFHTNLRKVLDAYKGPALPRTFVTGIVFQLIQALGVGRWTYGLHHNDLLTLANIKLKIIPAESPLFRPYWCYRLSEHATEQAGNQDNILATGEGSGKLPYGQEVSVVPKFAGKDHPVPTLDADLLPQSNPCAAGAADKGSTPAGSQGAPPEDVPRNTWCIDVSSVDFMLVKLHGFSAATLSKKQIEWWKLRYTFQNGLRRDDMLDVAVILCGVMGAKMATIPDDMAALCRAMRAGEYADNPLAALKHDFFKTLPPSDDIPLADRSNFVFLPKPRAGVKKAPTGTPSSGDKPPPQGSDTAVAHTWIAPSRDVRQEPALHAPKAAAAAAAAADDAVADSGTPPMMPPWIVEKTLTSVKLAWAPTALASPGMPAMYSLFLDGITVYSGPSTVYLQGRLRADKCYRFQVAAFAAGKWTPRSELLFVNNCAPPPMAAVEADERGSEAEEEL